MTTAEVPADRRDVASVTRSQPERRAHQMLWLALGFVLIGYGLIALNAGTRISPLNTDGPQALAQVDHIIEQADMGVPMQDSEGAQAVIPFWINLLARIKSSEYAHGSDGIMEAERHYYVMPEKKRHVLGTHMMLGIVLMTAGFFQFWPSFRRRHRKAHRIAGAIYLVAAIASLGMSSYYLIHTAIADVYSQFAFFAGLWSLVAVATFSLGMAMWSLVKRDLGAHLGWQALAFGCFLTAPIQRGLWMALSPFSDGATFNEVNIVPNVVLVPLSFFAAYALFAVNRSSSTLRPGTPALLEVSTSLRRILIGLGLVMGAASAGMFLISGLSGTQITERMAMSTAAQVHDASVLGVRGVAVFVLLTATMVAGIRVLVTRPKAINAAAVGILGLLASGALVTLGYSIGMPSHQSSLAGAGYAFNGVLLVAVVAWGALHLRSGNAGKLREMVWFIVLLSMSPALTYLFMFFYDAIGIVPAPFVAKGHGYQVAAATGLLIPVMVGHLLAVYSHETRRHAIN